MGYTGPYSLSQRCAAEFVATWMFIFLLLGVLANKLLPKTKGHDIAFGWIALGIGLACFLPVQYFGYISSMVNPAMALANAVAEVIDWSDVLPIAACQFAGAFLGAVTLWIFYLPHFATVPEPPPPKISDELLRTRDYINQSSLAYASYSTQLPADVTSLSQGLKQFTKVMKGNSRFRAYKDEDLLGRHSLVGRSGVTRRRSVNESDLHERLLKHRQEHSKKPQSTQTRVKKAETPSRMLSDPQRPMWPMSSDDEDAHQPLLQGTSPTLRQAMSHHHETAVTIQEEPDLKPSGSSGRVHHDVSMRSLQALANHDTESGFFYEPGSDPGSDFLDSGASGDDRRPGLPRPKNGTGPQSAFLQPPPPVPEKPSLDKGGETEGEGKKLTKSQRLHQASVKADQNAKLAVFATRPAMFVPICNLINEILATMLLTSGILMLNQRGAMIWEGDKEVYMHGLKSFWVGILVVVLILCLGGPGCAMNPARDLGPRVAHWLLPIAGKGPSEWYYGWITVVGPFIGGLLGGVFYNWCDMLNESAVHRGYYSDALHNLTEMATEL